MNVFAEHFCYVFGSHKLLKLDFSCEVKKLLPSTLRLSPVVNFSLTLDTSFYVEANDRDVHCRKFPMTDHSCYKNQILGCGADFLQLL